MQKKAMPYRKYNGLEHGAQPFSLGGQMGSIWLVHRPDPASGRNPTPRQAQRTLSSCVEEVGGQSIPAREGGLTGPHGVGFSQLCKGERGYGPSQWDCGGGEHGPTPIQLQGEGAWPCPVLTGCTGLRCWEFGRGVGGCINGHHFPITIFSDLWGAMWVRCDGSMGQRWSMHGLKS